MTNLDKQPVETPMDAEQLRLLRERQKGRAKVMALVLAGLCVLFYFITIAKMQVFG